MKAYEHKIRQTIPPADLPAFFRRLADAIENKSDRLTAEGTDLPEHFTKLAVKGKFRDDGWEMKVKLKADTALALPSEPVNREAPAMAAGQTDDPGTDYKALKKRMKTAFRTIGEAIAGRRLPDADTVKAFLVDSERMTAFAGEFYGQACYPAYREACRQLARAYEARDWSAFTEAYAALDQLKKDCHKAFK